jgi:hypothetical protein
MMPLTEWSMSAGSCDGCTEIAFSISAVLLCGSGKWSDQTAIGQKSAIMHGRRSQIILVQ